MTKPSYTPPPTEHPAATIKRDLNNIGRCVCCHMKGRHHIDGCGDWDVDPKLPDPIIRCICPEYTEMAQ